jgi:hypothetical protein
MDLSFIFFVFINIVVILGITYRFYAAGDEFGSLVILAGFIGAAAFFGIRWFTGKGAEKEATGPWPPLLNTCPDVLTLHTNGTDKFCVDTVGVAKGGSSNLQKMTNASSINDNQKFNLSIALSGEARYNALCTECRTKGVTWEGVYNGNSCLNRDPPKP